VNNARLAEGQEPGQPGAAAGARGAVVMPGGSKQSEVFLFMLHLRERLEVPFAEILRSPPPFRSRLAKNASAEIGPEEPRDDRRVFLVIHRVKFSETFPPFPYMDFKRSKAPILPDPFFCYGVDDLRDKLDTMDHIFRRAIVIEIAHMAAMIAELLELAPVRRRGRPLQTRLSGPVVRRRAWEQPTSSK
jgi:hypothetical protein